MAGFFDDIQQTTKCVNREEKEAHNLPNFPFFIKALDFKAKSR